MNGHTCKKDHNTKSALTISVQIKSEMNGERFMGTRDTQDVSLPSTSTKKRRKSTPTPLSGKERIAMATKTRLHSEMEAKVYFNSFPGCRGCGGMPVIYMNRVRIKHFPHCLTDAAFRARHPSVRLWYGKRG